jgi:hypothetical protein
MLDKSPISNSSNPASHRLNNYGYKSHPTFISWKSEFDKKKKLLEKLINYYIIGFEEELRIKEKNKIQNQSRHPINQV